MDDAQRRTIANELQKPNYDHLIYMLFVWKSFSGCKYYQIWDRSLITVHDIY